jgi:hypothetical protein
MLNFYRVGELRIMMKRDLIAQGKRQIHPIMILPYVFSRGGRSDCGLIHPGSGFLAPLGWLRAKIKRNPCTFTLCGLESTSLVCA